MAEPLGWCVEAVREAAEPGLGRALLALRIRHTRRPGGAARFREKGGLGPLLELLGPERPRRILDLALSVLGNCCTEGGCRRQARSLGGVPRLVALLSSPGPESVQNRVARTLANLALEPDGARDILEAGAGPLLVSLAASCGTPECLHSAARALRILAASPAPRRALARAGAVRALASRLASLSPAHPARPSLARALRGLTEDPVGADDVAPALPALASLATDSRRDRRRPALGAIANACARARLRPALGAAGAVEAVTEEVRRGISALDEDAAGAVRALCLLCREAVNRARVRAAGGLALLLRLLGEPRARPWRSRVLLALAAFAYDAEALAAMEERGVVPLLADVLRARAEEDGEEEDDDEEEDEEEDEDEEEEEEEEDEAAASWDLPRETPPPRGDGAAAGSWRGLKSWLLSETSSPPPSPPLPLPKCPSPSSAPPPPRRRLPPMAALALPRGVGEGDPWLPETPALLLLGRLASADEPSRALATAPVVSGLLRYLTGVPAPAPRALRLLQRLVGHPAFLGALIRAYVPSLLRSWLVLGLPPARAEELSRPGRKPGGTPAAAHPRRERLKELGEGLLRNLGAAAATPFGVGLLTHMLRCGTPPARLACATALPLLARPDSPARALLWGGGAVALLLSAVARGHPSPYEPPPAFALYAADAISVLRGDAGDAPERPDNGRPDDAREPQVLGDVDPQDVWGRGDAEDPWGHRDVGDGDPRSHPEPRGDTWGHSNGSSPSPASLLPPPLLSPLSPSPRGTSPPSPRPPWPHVSPGATKRSRMSPDPPEGDAPRPPKSPRPPLAPDPCPCGSPASPCPQTLSLVVPEPRPCVSPTSPRPHMSPTPRPQAPFLVVPEPCPHLSPTSPCPHVSPTSLCPQTPSLVVPEPRPCASSTSPCPQTLRPVVPEPCHHVSPTSPCPHASPTSPHPHTSPTSPRLHLSPTSPCPHASPTSPRPHASPTSPRPQTPRPVVPEPRPRASPPPRPRTPSPVVPEPSSPPCPYSRSPHDLLVLPDGVPPGVPATRRALTRGSPVLGAMLGGSFAEATQAAVTLSRVPRRPLLLLLHFLHGCRTDACPLLSPPVPAGAAGAAVALARRYLVDGFEDAAAAAVVTAASPDVLWALAERWGCVPLAVRAADALLAGPPREVAPRLARVARRTRCPRRLARALVAAVAPPGVRLPPNLEAGEPWGQGDPLVAPQGDVPEDLEDAFGVPQEESGDVEEPPVTGGDPSGDDGDEVELEGTL